MNILLFCTGNLMGIARFPKTLHQAGFTVSLLCAPGSFISKTRYVQHKRFLRRYKPCITLYNSLAKDLSTAIDDCEPQLVIPGDERAVYCLHKIARSPEAEQLQCMSRKNVELIQKSLCHPTFYQATNNKNTTQGVAKDLGIRVPEQVVVRDQHEALRAAVQLQYPIVLKKGIGEAGLGVRICQTEQQLLEYLRLPLFRHPKAYRQLLRKLLRRESSWVPNNESLALQQYIVGTPAIHCVAAIAGKVLASYTAVKDFIYPYPTGQCSRIRFVNHPEIANTVAKLVSYIGYTGFGDFEFLLEESTDLPYFLECNPRPSTIFHLGEKIGVDLGKAMFAGLSGQSYSPSPCIDEQRQIMLFPNEWRRDPQSVDLHSEFHDVPWDDPLLLKAYFQAC